MGLLIKFSYDGSRYSGFQRGNGENNVEGNILSVLKEQQIADDIHTAARTDKGVSAVSNAFCVITDQDPVKVLGILNARIPGMLFHSWSYVRDDFNPRHCDQKLYSYAVVTPGKDLERSVMKFEGRHDFMSFCRKDQRNPVRTIDRIEVVRAEYGSQVLFYAKSFVWEQIRSIMGYVLKNPDPEEDPYSTPGPRSVAPPEPLILQDITYKGLKFTHSVSSSKKRFLEKEFFAMLMKVNLYQAVRDKAVQ